MDSIKRLFYIGIVAVGCLIILTSRVGAAGCLDDRSYVNERGFKVECSKSQREGNVVQVTCQSDDWAAFPDFNVNLTTVGQIHFINCSYAQNSSLLDIFRLMNMSYSKVKEIYFENLGSTPCRQNFQGLTVDELKFEESNFTELPFDMLYDVLGIKRLVIMSTNLVEIPNNFFNVWSRDLETLDLLYNKLRKIGKNDFVELGKVRELILFGNEISEIEAAAFDSLSNLEILELSNNNLRALPSGIFGKLAKLDTIILKQNMFDELPSDLLTSIQDCHLNKFHMNLNGGSLKTLPNGFFKNLSFLTQVQLEDNQFENLPTDLFDETSEIKNLSLKGNFLTSLTLGFFASLENLQKLNLSKNQITNLLAGIFEKQDNLNDLDISYNNLTTLEPGAFKGLESLTNLNASHNSFLKLNDAWCNPLKAVKVIDFSFNQLSLSVSSDSASIFAQCGPSLDDIYFSHNRATEICYDLVTRRNIDLSYNELTNLTTEDIKHVQIIREIDLRNNRISNINLTNFASAVADYKEENENKFPEDPAIFILGNNPLHCDCHLIDLVRYWNSEPNSEFRQYVKLTATDSDTQDLTCVSPFEMKKFSLSDIRPENLYCKLKTVRVDDACTNNCTCREYPARQVLSVDCSHKNLTQWPALISNVNNWSIELNMSHNVLMQTPSLKIPYFANVTILDLSYNNISVVTIDLFSKNLINLKLHGNRISRLDHAVIKHLANDDNLLAITLHQNPWVCDCEARDLINFVQKKTSIYRLDGIVCVESNEKLYKMTVSEICSSAIAITVAASLLVAFFGLVLGILAALYYKYQREIKVWLYSKQWCLWFVTEDELDKDKKYDAFVSFSHKDEDFVEKEIVAKLEDGPRPYKLCLHYRDWLAGEWIPVQISQSVEDSRRTIVVLSANFLESVWGRLEFRAAHTQALKEGRARVIIILYGEIENMDNLDPELKSYLSLNTYVKWGDPWFWDKLRYALPHKFEPSRRRTRNAQLIEDHLMCQPVRNDSASAKSNAISMSNIANDSDKLLESGVNGRTVVSC